MVIYNPNLGVRMKTKTFFTSPENVTHRQYEALRAFFTGECNAAEAAERFGYTLSAFYSLTRDFRKILSDKDPARFLFTHST